MKNVFKTISFIMLTLTLLISLASCKTCKHTKTQTVAECFIDATETSEGSYDEVVYCLDCDEELERFSRTIPKLSCNHTDDNEDFACDKCNIFFIGTNHRTHTFDRKVVDEKYLASEANCTEAALYYKSCGCGEAGKETFTDGWIKHSFTETVKEECLVSEASCASPAIYYKSCECGEISTETFKSGKRLSHVFENEICTLCGEPFRYLRSGDYIYFGEFPQTIKAKSVSITDIPSSAGVYIGTDGERYMKVKANPYHKNNAVFSNGEKIVPGEDYYFKIEPIKWRIILEEDNTVFLHCDSIIANMAFDAGGETDYFKSDLREWLNGEFLNTAFTAVEREIIETRTTVGDKENVETDMIYTLTVEEAKEYMYDEANWSWVPLLRMTSDYARATGALFANISNYYNVYGRGEWWSATAGTGNYENTVFTVGNGGSATQRVDVKETHGGVAPFVKIELK